MQTEKPNRRSKISSRRLCAFSSLFVTVERNYMNNAPDFVQVEFNMNHLFNWTSFYSTYTYL